MPQQHPKIPHIETHDAPSGDVTGEQHIAPPEKAADTGGACFRYDFDIDLESDSTHTSVVRMVGSDRDVLELGSATGYMSKALAERGCSVVGVELDPRMAEIASQYCVRMIVGDIESLDLEAELGDERFDVIVAADVLEHLRDPLGALRRLRRFLKPDSGFFVVSLPNVAHGSVRLALLQGRFAYQDLGLLDATHLRFFTRESIEQLFDEAELGITEMNRRELNIDASEVQFDRASVPDELMKAITADPDARTYQFVVKAFPLDQPGMRNLQHRLRSQALAVDAMQAELDQVREQFAHAQADREELAGTLSTLAAREGELRRALVDAHDQVLGRDEEIARLLRELQRLGGLEQQRQDLISANDALQKAQSEAQALIALKADETHRLRVRLDRILSSPPARLWSRLGRLPVVRRVVARRNAAYLAALSDDSGA